MLTPRACSHVSPAREPVVVIKVYESFDYMQAGRVRSLLESNGIETFMKNEFLSGALGELPFQEVAPQVFILRADDLDDALRLIAEEI